MIMKIILLLSVFAMRSAEAAPMLLKCNAVWDGPIFQTLTVDLEARRMKFGLFDYKIVSITERFITGYNADEHSVGGEVWVLDRESGEYWRAAVTYGWDASTDYTAPLPPKKVSPATYHGKCFRPI